jgi:hypothetical protein
MVALDMTLNSGAANCLLHLLPPKGVFFTSNRILEMMKYY